MVNISILCTFSSLLSSLSQVRAVHWPPYLPHLVPPSLVASPTAAEQDMDQRMSSHESRMWKWLSWVATEWSPGTSLLTHPSWQQSQSSTSVSSVSSMCQEQEVPRKTQGMMCASVYNIQCTICVCQTVESLCLLLIEWGMLRVIVFMEPLFLKTSVIGTPP